MPNAGTTPVYESALRRATAASTSSAFVRVSNTTMRGRLCKAALIRDSGSRSRRSGSPSQFGHRGPASGGARSSGKKRIALVVATLFEIQQEGAKIETRGNDVKLRWSADLHVLE